MYLVANLTPESHVKYCTRYLAMKKLIKILTSKTYTNSISLPNPSVYFFFSIFLVYFSLFTFTFFSHFSQTFLCTCVAPEMQVVKS